ERITVRDHPDGPAEAGHYGNGPADAGHYRNSPADAGHYRSSFSSASTSVHPWKRAHQRASRAAIVSRIVSVGSCASSAFTVAGRQPPKTGRSMSLSAPPDTASVSAV